MNKKTIEKLKWKIEFIGNYANILIGVDKETKDVDRGLVGLGFPSDLAEQLVKLHNESLDIVFRKIKV